MRNNGENARIKRAYRPRLKAARRLCNASTDVTTAAIQRLEEYSGFALFKEFQLEQAVAPRRINGRIFMMRHGPLK